MYCLSMPWLFPHLLRPPPHFVLNLPAFSRWPFARLHGSGRTRALRLDFLDAEDDDSLLCV
jgi:hypothetical protein